MHAADAPATAYSPHLGEPLPRNLYFGDTHVHTGLSADAGGSGTRLMPDAAYRLARGELVKSNTGQPVRLVRPFDFFMVTDHSDAMGAIMDILQGTPEIMADDDARQLHEEFNAGPKRATAAMYRLIQQFAQGQSNPVINYQPGHPAFRRVWEQLVDAAERFYEPRHFTTFAAFEWTSLVQGNNLHRNVILRDGADQTLQVVPFTATPPLGSLDPRDLWDWMAAYEENTGGRAIAMAHNGNLSNGWMFPMQDDFDGGAPLDAAYARLRQRWEPLYEITQFKGDGETHPLLSPDDAFADFETWDFGNLDASEKKTPAMLPGDYARSGLLRGLQLQARTGVNPYKFGLQGATDTHTGLSTPDEDNFFGKFTPNEPSPARAMRPGRSNPEKGIKGYVGWMYNSAGVTAVWAPENTREAIFDAMARRETYATTGPRIALRFFGGWEFGDGDVHHPDLARRGYEAGVPMGSDLPPRVGQDAAPTFLVSALRDPMGANLDRVQIIKGWLDSEGQPREKVHDVVWSDDRGLGADGRLAAVGNTVDLATASYSNSIGAAQLSTVWRDPDFDPSQPAFYYLRVIEIPTPRWPAFDAVRFGLALPDDVTLVTQERAYSSPIWYQPR